MPRTLTLTTAGLTARAISTQLGAGTVATAGALAARSVHTRCASRPKPASGESATSSSTTPTAGHVKRPSRVVIFIGILLSRAVNHLAPTRER